MKKKTVKNKTKTTKFTATQLAVLLSAEKVKSGAHRADIYKLVSELLKSAKEIDALKQQNEDLRAKEMEVRDTQRMVDLELERLAASFTILNHELGQKSSFSSVLNCSLIQ